MNDFAIQYISTIMDDVVRIKEFFIGEFSILLFGIAFLISASLIVSSFLKG